MIEKVCFMIFVESFDFPRKPFDSHSLRKEGISLFMFTDRTEQITINPFGELNHL